MPNSDSRFDDQLVNAFIGLQLTGGLGLTLIVLTALGSHTVKRNSTWYTFCVSWIISSISYTFIFLIGQQKSPNFAPCVTQSAGIYAAPALTACSTLAFAIDMFFGMRAAFANKPPKRRLLITLALLTAPFIVWLSVFLGMLVFGLNNPFLAEKGPNGTYCDLASYTPAKISGLIAVFATTCILIIEGYIGICLFRNRTLLRSGPTTRMAFRVIVFSLLGALCLGIGIAYVLFSKQGPAFDIILACIPVSGVLIFGSQADLLNVWLFWRRRETTMEYDDVKSPGVLSVPTPRF